MRIQQQAPHFHPIIITLETREEANALWDLMDEHFAAFHGDSPERDLAIKISNWFACRTEDTQGTL